jgi:hypothetical protein
MRKVNFNTNTSNNGEWLTPPEIITALGSFDLDPCSPVNRPWDTASNHYCENDDGLLQDWSGRVWCNPPYGKETFKWLQKLSAHKSGIALIFARTETIGFHQQIWCKAHSVFFFKGRLKFHYVTGEKGDTANAPSCLVSYSRQDTDSIIAAIQSGTIKGKIVLL